MLASTNCVMINATITQWNSLESVPQRCAVFFHCSVIC